MTKFVFSECVPGGRIPDPKLEHFFDENHTFDGAAGKFPKVEQDKRGCRPTDRGISGELVGSGLASGSVGFRFPRDHKRGDARQQFSQVNS